MSDEEHEQLLYDSWSRYGAGQVTAKYDIEQAPSSDDPVVPAGTGGEIQDVDDVSEGYRVFFVDFGEPYGVVMCEADELE